MNSQAIREQLPQLVANHLPRNVGRFRFQIYDGHPKVSGFGFHVDPQPFEGKVIAAIDEAIVVKTGRAEFAVLDRTLLTCEPEVGVRVRVQPYARRRFDGKRADTPEERTETASDGRSYTVTSVLLGAAPAKLPVNEVQCPELQELILQLEKLPAPDGFRRISHLLVDAGAMNFTWVDPLPEDIIATPPAINFDVASGKFREQVVIQYDRGADVYVIETHRDGALVERVEWVHFDMLGETLERLIDDGSWRRIKVEQLQ